MKLLAKIISILFLILSSSQAFTGIGGSGGGVSKSWKEILSSSDKYLVKGEQLRFSKGISTLFIPVTETCARYIENDPIIETKDEIYHIEIDQNFKKIEVKSILSLSVREFSSNPIRPYNLTIYPRNGRYSPTEEKNKFTKTFEIPNCSDLEK